MSNKFNGFTVDEIHQINSKSEQGNNHHIWRVLFFCVLFLSIPTYFFPMLLCLLLRVNKSVVCVDKVIKIK